MVAYLATIILIATLRKALWLFSGLFFLIDEFMWFAYNPFRILMKDKEASANRVGYYLFMLLLVKPLWQICVWILTTPLRFVTALYFDVLVYLFVSLSDSVDELLHPKLGKMRHRKGMAYWSRWLVGMPFRAGWLLYKNALAVVDSVMMFVISLVWPTFTMYHGTSPTALYDITQKGRWLVGGGNFGGSSTHSRPCSGSSRPASRLRLISERHFSCCADRPGLSVCSERVGSASIAGLSTTCV